MPAPGHKIGKENLRKVKKYFKEHLCATQLECSQAVGLSVFAVGRYVKRIRAEWLNGNGGLSR